MNLLNIKKLAAALTVACSLVFASSASAATLAVGDAYYLGSITDGVPASEENETAWVNFMITRGLNSTTPFSPNPTAGGTESIYRSNNNFGVLSSISVADMTKYEDDDLENPITLTGAIYILGKYGAGQSAGQISHVWYVGSFESETTFTLPGTALSHISVWSGETTRVPDSASTLLLIGLGLASVGFVARRRKA